MGEPTVAQERSYTTINVNPDTKDKLAAIKRQYYLESYNAAVEYLIRKRYSS